MTLLERWVKAAALEVQEYMRLVSALLRGIARGPYYRRDIVEQFEIIGVGSLTVAGERTGDDG